MFFTNISIYNLPPNTTITFLISFMDMNPIIILAVSTLLASTTSASTYYDSMVNAAGANISPASTVTPPYQTPQIQPPLCVLPPPSTTLTPPSTTLTPPSTALPPPARLPTPPLSPAAAGGKPGHAGWCVAKPTAAASAMQPALDYACASGADCGPIQVGGACFQPDTVAAHSSYAFNSYWQKTKSGGGTCDFGGAATIVTVDPSHDQCHFLST